MDLGELFIDLSTPRGLLLAVSGGPDSTALLLLIDRWRRNAGVPVTVATVDHRLREGSAQEAAAVAALCVAHGLLHRTLVREGPPFRTRIQERAREVRYDLLCRHAAAVGADTIVTAHHAEDQAETILMRLLRGSGPAGLAGMAARTERGSVTIARPLLGVSKTRLVEICKAEGVVFADDPSNRSDHFFRTRLRALMPVLAREGLDTAALVRLGRRAARAESALRWAERVARSGLDLRRTPSRATMSAEALAALPEEVVLRIVAAELTAMSPGSPLRLARIETLVTRLRTAIDDRVPFAATLAGCTVRFRRGTVDIEHAPVRKPTRSAAG